MAYPEIESEVIQRINEFTNDATGQLSFARDSLASLREGITTALGSGVEYDFSGGDVSQTAFTIPTYYLPTTVTPPTFAHLDAPEAPDITEYPDVISGVTGLSADTVTGDTLSPITQNVSSINMAPTVTGTPSDTALGFSLPAELDALSIPTFTSALPAGTLDALTAAYSYEETTYQELLKDETQALILDVLNGTLVVSDSVWDSSWDRAVGDANAQQVAEEWAATNLAASMGMTGMISETLLARLDAAEQKASERISAVRLEQAVQEAIQRREDKWNGVKNAVAFEQMWISQHDKIQGRALASAAKAHEAVVAVYNANVARYNALLAYAAQSVEFGQLELGAVQKQIEEYQLKLQRVELLLRDDDNRVKLWLGEWDGWKAEQDIKAKLAELNIRQYAEVVEGDKTRLAGDVAIEGKRVDVASANARIISEIKRLELDSQKEVEASKALGASSRTSTYNALWEGIQIEQAALAALMNAQSTRIDTDTKRRALGYQYEALDTQTELHKADKIADTALKNLEITLNSSLSSTERFATLNVGALQAFLSASDVSLSAGASAGVHWSQSISGDCNADVSCIPV